MKLSSEMIHNLPYFWNKKTQIGFFVFNFEQLWIFNSGQSTVKKIQKLFGFSHSKNMANFEAFCKAISLSISLLFLKSEYFDEKCKS